MVSAIHAAEDAHKKRISRVGWYASPIFDDDDDDDDDMMIVVKATTIRVLVFSALRPRGRRVNGTVREYAPTCSSNV